MERRGLSISPYLLRFDTNS
jgi:hypothetical protein